MKNSLLAALLVPALLLPAKTWEPALRGYDFQFPRDHFSHPGYKTEWWYYTGNLKSENGRRFGFELTFFRAGLNLSPTTIDESTPAWRRDEVWLAHLALSDLDGKKFFHTERMNRTGPGLAGVSREAKRYWNANWQVRWLSDRGDQQLEAVCDQFTVDLHLSPAKPPIINGRDGVSQKGPERGAASHYISFTRLLTHGDLHYRGERLTVDGLTWMDHEFFSESHGSSLAGWDWFAIQLESNEELMLYRLRLASGQESPFSSGTYVDARGNAQTLSASDFSLQPGSRWHSENSGASYPVAWTLSIPKLQLELSETTELEKQELFIPSSVTPTYWEGAVGYSGRIHNRPIRGVGYLEMTGYGRQSRSIF